MITLRDLIALLLRFKDILNKRNIASKQIVEGKILFKKLEKVLDKDGVLRSITDAIGVADNLEIELSNEAQKAYDNLFGFVEKSRSVPN